MSPDITIKGKNFICPTGTENMKYIEKKYNYGTIRMIYRINTDELYFIVSDIIKEDFDNIWFKYTPKCFFSSFIHMKEKNEEYYHRYDLMDTFGLIHLLELSNLLTDDLEKWLKLQDINITKNSRYLN